MAVAVIFTWQLKLVSRCCVQIICTVFLGLSFSFRLPHDVRWAINTQSPPPAVQPRKCGQNLDGDFVSSPLTLGREKLWPKKLGRLFSSANRELWWRTRSMRRRLIIIITTNRQKLLLLLPVHDNSPSLNRCLPAPFSSSAHCFMVCRDQNFWVTYRRPALDGCDLASCLGSSGGRLKAVVWRTVFYIYLVEELEEVESTLCCIYSGHTTGAQNPTPFLSPPPSFHSPEYPADMRDRRFSAAVASMSGMMWHQIYACTV